jgi:hypothetical protein
MPDATPDPIVDATPALSSAEPKAESAAVVGANE